MSKHYEFFINVNGIVSENNNKILKYIHCESFVGQSDRTLCGVVFDGLSENDDDDYYLDLKETSKKIKSSEFN